MADLECETIRECKFGTTDGQWFFVEIIRRANSVRAKSLGFFMDYHGRIVDERGEIVVTDSRAYVFDAIQLVTDWFNSQGLNVEYVRDLEA